MGTYEVKKDGGCDGANRTANTTSDIITVPAEVFKYSYKANMSKENVDRETLTIAWFYFVIALVDDTHLEPQIKKKTSHLPQVNSVVQRRYLLTRK